MRVISGLICVAAAAFFFWNGNDVCAVLFVLISVVSDLSYRLLAKLSEMQRTLEMLATAASEQATIIKTRAAVPKIPQVVQSVPKVPQTPAVPVPEWNRETEFFK